MRRLLVLLSTLILAACFSSGRRGEVAIVLYDLGPAIERQAEAVLPTAMALEVRAPLWFDALGINYRLAYAEPARLREYARSRWAGPPAQLIQMRLIRELGLISAGQGRAACVLRVEIDEFSQIYDTQASSRGVIQGRVQWLDRGRGRLAERVIHIEKPAEQLGAQSGVAALTAAVAQLSVAIQSWNGELLGSGQLASCRR